MCGTSSTPVPGPVPARTCKSTYCPVALSAVVPADYEETLRPAATEGQYQYPLVIGGGRTRTGITPTLRQISREIAYRNVSTPSYIN